MTKFRRVLNFFTALVMMLAGLVLCVMNAQDGIKFVLFFTQVAMTVRGLQSIVYYFSMAKHMVGGKRVLYRGMIFLDLGMLAGDLFDHPGVYTLIYIAALHIFSGVVSILRANESRVIGGAWKLKMAYGATNVLLAVAVIVFGVVYGQLRVAVWVYGAGLIYSAILRIASSFRRTEIVYIQ